MNARLHERLQARIAEIERQNRWKDYRVFDSGPGARIRAKDAGSLLLFTSNDYLGLAAHPRVIGAMQTSLLQYGAGTASARFVCGTTSLHRILEREIAELCGTESALTFTSGWAANLGLIATLPESGDLILADAANHASLIDGGKLAAKGVERIVVPHGDVAAVERALAAWRGRGIPYCVTDGVFSMEGSLAPLPQLAEVTRKHRAILIVDDAHGIGVVGATGRGCVEHFDLLGQIDIITGSLGKALGGVAGGFVAANSAVVALLEQTARAMLFTTAMTPAAAAASCEAIRVLRSTPALVADLRDKVATFVDSLVEHRLLSRRSSRGTDMSAIVPLIVGASATARTAARELEAEGIYVSCFSHPVVPEGEARLRMQISRAHSYDDLAYCAAACRKTLRPA